MPNTDAARPGEVAACRVVLIVDDHDLVRLGLQTLLLSRAAAGAPPLEVIEARTLQGALDAHRERSRDIAVTLLDLHLPDAFGLAGLESLLAGYPSARVVVLSGSTDPALRRRALALGAAAFLSKSADLQHVIDYLGGEGLFEAGAAVTRPVTRPAPTSGDEPGDPDRIAICTAEGRSVQLTRRQLQVLERILAGQSNREIADQTHLTEGTIKNHVSALLLLFGARSRSQLISLLR
jgi:DNA-binding NarL/FixJ family response regulator